MAVLDHGKSGGAFVDQSENILDLQQQDIKEGYESVNALMQGMIVKFDVKVGDSVWEGKILGVMEAMKMEHKIQAPKAGKISSLIHEVGQRVDMGVILIEIKE